MHTHNKCTHKLPPNDRPVVARCYEYREKCIYIQHAYHQPPQTIDPYTRRALLSCVRQAVWIFTCAHTIHIYTQSEIYFTYVIDIPVGVLLYIYVGVVMFVAILMILSLFL